MKKKVLHKDKNLSLVKFGGKMVNIKIKKNKKKSAAAILGYREILLSSNFYSRFSFSILISFALYY